MVRSILRNVQNSLVLGAVALCILAFQRLESLDSVHKPTPSSLWPYPPDAHHFSDNDDQGSAHYELIFGREIHFGLFRFPLPLLQKHPKSVLNDAYNSKESDDKAKNLRVVLQEKREGSVVMAREEAQHDGGVAILISIRDCSNDEMVDAAAVLMESLPSDSNVRLHAILDDDKENTVKCGGKLQGYELLSANKALGNVTASCLTKEETVLLIANTLDADVVLYAPLPAIAISHSSEASVSLLADELKSVAKSSAEIKKRIQEEKEKKISSILMIRPQRQELINGPPVTDLINDYCDKKKSANNTESFTMGNISPWRPCTRQGERTCRISDSVGIATLTNCPLTHTKESSGNKTPTDAAAECRELRLKWLQSRNSIMAKQNQDAKSE